MIPDTPLNITGMDHSFEWLREATHSTPPDHTWESPEAGVLGPGVGVRIPCPFLVLARCWSRVEGAILISVTVTLSPTVRAVLDEGLGASTCV